MSLLAITLVAALMPTSIAGHTASSVDYVGGTQVPGAPAGTGLVICQGPPSAAPVPVGIGGACALTPPASTFTVTTTGATGFTVSQRNDANGACGSANVDVIGNGPATFTLGGACTHVTIFTHLGSTTGTIALS